VLAGLVVPFVAIMPGVAKVMDREYENENEIPAIHQESLYPLVEAVDTITMPTEKTTKPRPVGFESWEEMADYIETGIEELLKIKKRREEIMEKLSKAMERKDEAE
jgi:hypothetical protein